LVEFVVRREAIDRRGGFSEERGWTREDLLIFSRQLDEDVFSAIETIGSTRYTLMPSSRNLIPFMEAFSQIETPIQNLYNAASELHRRKIEEVLELIRPRTIYLPPLLSILMSRCQSYKDVPKRLAELRQEYAPLRQNVHEWFGRLDQASSMAEKLKIRDELTNALNGVLDKVTGLRPGFYKELAGTMVEAAEDGNPAKLLLKPAIAVAKEAVTNWVPDMLYTKRYTGLVNLLNDAFEIEDYGNLLRRVYGDHLDISQREITAAKSYRKIIIERYNIDLPTPG
jgi:hypothetical protein